MLSWSMGRPSLGFVADPDAAAEPFPHPCTPKRARPARFGDPALAFSKPQARDSGWHVERKVSPYGKGREIIFDSRQLVFGNRLVLLRTKIILRIRVYSRNSRLKSLPFIREHNALAECQLVKRAKLKGDRRCDPFARSRAMSMMVGARSTQSSEINVTPLIDVLLVLLIIFMVILPEHKWGEKTLVPQPSAESMEKNPETPIVIQLKDIGDGQRPLLKINQEEVSWDALDSRLTAVFKLRVDRVAFVKGDPEVDFEYVAQAVDITHHAGADRIGLLGKKD
jgi:biopolymer transport protein TolR